MSFLYPVIASLFGTASSTFDKIALKIKGLTYKSYNVVSFPISFIFTAIIFFILRPPSSLALFSGKYLLLLLTAIFLIASLNIIFYRALKEDDLGEIQTISLLSKVPLIILAGFIFTDERNPLIIIMAIIAASSVIWSHWERHHFHLAKRTMPLLFWTILVSPFGGIIYKILLEYWHPITLSLVINGAISIMFVSFFIRNLKSTPRQGFLILILTNVLSTIGGIFYLFSYQALGITYTVLVFSLEPVLVYLSSIIFLKEQPQKKKSIAFFIIVVSIAIAKIFGG